MDLIERGQGRSRHPWELARVRMIKRLLARAVPAQGAARLLDIGCGDGFVLSSLKDQPGIAQRIGVDPCLSSEDIIRLKEENIQACHDTATLNGRFDVILFCDVLEHVKEDKLLLENIAHDKALPGAIFLILVPARPWLFSSHDIFLKHFRRYSFAQLKDVIRGAGLELVDGGSLFSSLIFPRAITCFQERINGAPATGALQGAGHWNAPSWLTVILTTTLDWDNLFLWTLSRVGIRFPGLSLWAIVRRPA